MTDNLPSKPEGSILPFRRPGALLKPTAPPAQPIADIAQYERPPGEPDDYRHRMKMNVLALVVTVARPGGEPVAFAVIELHGPPALDTPAPEAVVVDQVNQAFTPDLTILPVGSSVTFPNSDKVSHQVYSFSPAKRFQLPLYRGTPYAPIRFDAPGIVTLGCNIHDRMQAWVHVVDTPIFGKTDAAGKVVLDVPADIVEFVPYMSFTRIAKLELTNATTGAAGRATAAALRGAGFLSDDIVLAIFTDRRVVPFGGVTIGKGAALRRLAVIAGMLELLKYERLHVVESGASLRSTVAYHARHKATGEDISGRQRHIVRIRGDQICRFEIYHDRALMEAFFRLVRSLAPLL